MYNSLNNLANAVKSDATNLAKLTMKNANLKEQLKIALAQNRMLTDLLRKQYVVSQKLSQKTRTQIKGNVLKRKGDVIIAQSHKKTV